MATFKRNPAVVKAPPEDTSDSDDDTESEPESEPESESESAEAADESLSEGGEGEASESDALEASAPVEEQGVSAELVELALEVLDSDDVAPVVRLAFERAAPGGVVAALEVIVERKTGEAEALVAAHYGAFVAAMGELAHVQQDAEALSSAADEHGGALQAAGQPLLACLTALEGARREAERLQAAGAAAEAACAALAACRRCLAALEGGAYYSCLRQLARLQTERLPTLPCAALRAYCAAQVPATEALVEERARALLEAWLADADAAAPRIGRAAVAQAAAARAAVHARWEAQLAAVEACAQPGPLAAVGFTLRGAAAEAAAAEAEAAAGPLNGLSLGRVATARHAHASLGVEAAFWAHYAARRAQALAQALQGGAQGEFLEHYQGFFCAIAGFFIIEAAVARASGGRRTAGELAALWDGAAAALAAAVAAQLEAAPEAAALAALADYTQLLGAALRRQGLWTAALDAALHDGRERYGALAAAEAVAALAAAFAAAPEPLTLSSPAAYAAEVAEVGLHPAGEALPSAADFPLIAPFSHAVPAALRALRAHAADVAAFCAASGEEGLRTLSAFTDALLQRLVADALQPRLARFAADPVTLCQLAADAAALDAGAAAAEEAAAQLCHVAEGRAAALAVAAMAADGAAAAPMRPLRAHREAAEEALLRGLTQRCDAFFAAAPLEDWLPDAPRTSARQAAVAAAALLAHTAAAAAALLAGPTRARLLRTALGHAADALLGPITRPEEGGKGRRFNVHALAGLRADVAALEGALAEAGSGLEGALAEAAQLCALFLPPTPGVEALAAPGCEGPAFRAALQGAAYALAPQRLALLLERYRELPGTGLLHRGAPAGEGPRRRTVALVQSRVEALLRGK